MGFRVLLEKLEGLEGLVEEIAAEAAPKIEALVSQEFSAQKDPYGKAWAPLAPSTVRRKGSSRILTHTGAMASSVNVKAEGASIALSIDDPGIHHQFGTKHMPARPVLPSDSLPQAWQDEIEGAAARAVAKALK